MEENVPPRPEPSETAPRVPPATPFPKSPEEEEGEEEPRPSPTPAPRLASVRDGEDDEDPGVASREFQEEEEPRPAEDASPRRWRRGRTRPKTRVRREGSISLVLRGDRGAERMRARGGEERKEGEK